MSDRTRLEFFAAAALTGILAGKLETNEEVAAEMAVDYALKLGRSIDDWTGKGDPDERADDA
jgi:hypothetical protein